MRKATTVHHDRAPAHAFGHHGGVSYRTPDDWVPTAGKEAAFRQLNTGGNTDFLNMLRRSRLASKKESKTEAVQAVAAKRLANRNIHVGPSDYVPWQDDNKVCFIRMEGRLFGDVPMNLELRLSVEDSPNSAGIVIDSIRCCKLALDRGQGGILLWPSAYFCKHPPKQFTDEEAYKMTEQFIAGNGEDLEYRSELKALGIGR